MYSLWAIPDMGWPISGIPDLGWPISGIPDLGWPILGIPDLGWPILGIPELGWPISGIPDLRLALFRKLFRKLRFLGMFSTSMNQFLASNSSSISRHVYSAKKIAQKRSFLREVRA